MPLFSFFPSGFNRGHHQKKGRSVEVYPILGRGCISPDVHERQHYSAEILLLDLVTGYYWTPRIP